MEHIEQIINSIESELSWMIADNNNPRIIRLTKSMRNDVYEVPMRQVLDMDYWNPEAEPKPRHHTPTIGIRLSNKYKLEVCGQKHRVVVGSEYDISRSQYIIIYYCPDLPDLH